jgi:hypothetical protein
MSHRLLLLLLDSVSREELAAAVSVPEGEVEAVYIVVPAEVGPLDWLATDERHAHGQAAARVLEAEWLLAGVAEIGGAAGESDPVVAVRDALEKFPADEIVVVGHGEVDASLLASLRSLGLPVSLSGVWPGLPGPRGSLRELVRGLRSGRSSATPWVAFALANLGLLLIGVVISLLVVLVVWLIER